jgi:hypothetical protein
MEWMGFTTHASASNFSRVTGAALRGLSLLAVLLLTSPVAWADGFVINAINTRLQENVYLFSAHIDFHPTEEVLEALKNGVPIPVLVEIEIQRKRKWWIDEDMATLEQRYRLQYHALSHQYLLQNVNSGAFYSFHTLDSALYALGRLQDLPLLDKQLIQAGVKYEVLIHAELEIEALPSPLRPLAYITPAWRLDSDWYTWSLKP